MQGEVVKLLPKSFGLMSHLVAVEKEQNNNQLSQKATAW